MANKLKLLLMVLLVGLMSIACQERENGVNPEVQPVENAGPVIYEETFEGPLPLYQAHNTDFGAPHSLAVVTDPVYRGARSARFELRDTDPMVSDGTRAEVTVVKDAVKEEMWYSFAVLFPSAGYEFDSEKEIISQWHQLPDAHLGEGSQSPPTYLVIQHDKFNLNIGYSRAQVSEGVDEDKARSFDLGPVTKDVWHEFVFHFIHSIHAQGLVEVWHNGTQVVRHFGGNMYNNVDPPKWKLGIYKWQWNHEDTTDTRERILYYDNIKVGNQKATLADMTPATSPGTNTDPPGPAADFSFTFVNADSDQDIVPFTTGALMTQNLVGGGKITIRAETKLKQVGSVKFVLKGGMNHEFVDNEPPYTLFGDDGRGNYADSIYLQPGSYNLKLTPYAGPNASGKGQPTASTSFTIKKY
jgi:hypothetical protein